MELPVDLSKTMHKHGGKITRIYNMAHECSKPQYERSRDTWWYVGDVTWNDGTSSKKIEIAPWCLCADGGAQEPELQGLLDLMSAYLLEHGEWYHEGKHQGWYANVRPEAKVRRRA